MNNHLADTADSAGSNIVGCNNIDADSVGHFADFSLAPELQRAITEAGFTVPRPIQIAALPHALRGQDILGLAQTGTGKTAAFALPILQHLLDTRSSRSSSSPSPRALVVAPTRELAMQIEAEIRMLGRFTRIGTASIFGGVSAHNQKKALRRNPEILVACPGRLLDLYEQGIVRLNAIEILVLDEADHMFDMGFLPSVRRILKSIPPKRQNLLFSATMPREIRELADKVLSDPKVLDLSQSMPAATIEHSLITVDEKAKFDLLRKVLASTEIKRAIVFTRTKHRARKIATRLEERGLRAIALQGNMSQPQRDRAMSGFRKGDFDVLVATDIAGRGIDVASVSCVINFDLPMTPDAYTHRIGRTGRSECQGQAYSFVTSSDREMVRKIEQRIGIRIPLCAISGFGGPGMPGDGDTRSMTAQEVHPQLARPTHPPLLDRESERPNRSGARNWNARGRGRGRSNRSRGQRAR